MEPPVSERSVFVEIRRRASDSCKGRNERGETSTKESSRSTRPARGAKEIEDVDFRQQWQTAK